MTFHLSVSGKITAKINLQIQARNGLETQNEELSLREIFDYRSFGHWEFEWMLKVGQAWALSDQQRKSVCIEDLMLKTSPFQIFRDRDCVTIHTLLSIRTM